MQLYNLERVRALLKTMYDTPHSLEDAEERLDLLAGLARLSPSDRQLLLWRAAGYSYREIAERLGMKRADSRVKQAERRLVALLSPM